MRRKWRQEGNEKESADEKATWMKGTMMTMILMRMSLPWTKIILMGEKFEVETRRDTHRIRKRVVIRREDIVMMGKETTKRIGLTRNEMRRREEGEEWEEAELVGTTIIRLLLLLRSAPLPLWQ